MIYIFCSQRHPIIWQRTWSWDTVSIITYFELHPSSNGIVFNLGNTIPVRLSVTRPLPLIFTTVHPLTPKGQRAGGVTKSNFQFLYR